MDTNILFKTNNFDVVKCEKKIGIWPSHLYVAILPFTRDDKGLPSRLGVMDEFNYVMSKNIVSAITGKAFGEDPDILTSAQKHMLDGTGLDVDDVNRWYYLGKLRTHKMINQEFACFACDITDLDVPEASKEDGDDEEDGRGSEFKLLSVNDALDTDDCFIPSIFMKIFKYIFGFSTSDKEGAQDAEEQSTKEEEQ